MALQHGTRVRVDGKEATVELSWASGKHRQTTLSDGRTIVNLEKAIADGDAEVLSSTVEEPVIDKERAGMRRLPSWTKPKTVDEEREIGEDEDLED